MRVYHFHHFGSQIFCACLYMIGTPLNGGQGLFEINEKITMYDPIHLTSSSEKSCMHHTGEQCLCALFSEVRILGNAAFTRKPIANQNGERDTVAAYDVHAKGQYLVIDILVGCGSQFFNFGRF